MEQVFSKLEDFKGVWLLANGRKLKITENPRELLLEVGSFPLIYVPHIWNIRIGLSYIDTSLDIMERVRECLVVESKVWGDGS
jgi:hypothetical protein